MKCKKKIKNQIQPDYSGLSGITIEAILKRLTVLGVKLGYFENPVQYSATEVIFTYPERYGLWGTPGFISQVVADAQAIVAKGLNPIITLEPYKDTATNPLPEITAGTIDGFLTNLFNGINAVAPNAIIRPMHEMETNQARYPWAFKPSIDYINAWIHLYNLNDGLSNNLKFLWSPAGDPLAPYYYPGDAYVDYVGFSLYETPTEVDLVWYGEDRQFVNEFVRKMLLLVPNKQVILPEVGIAGSNIPEKAQILKLLTDTIEIAWLNRIVSLNFFNTYETIPAFSYLDYRLQ